MEVAKGRGPGGSSSLSRPSPGVTGQGVLVRVWQVLSVVTGSLVGPGKAGPLSSNAREGRNNQQGVRLANVSDASSDALSDVSSSASASSNVFPVASTKIEPERVGKVQGVSEVSADVQDPVGLGDLHPVPCDDPRYLQPDTAAIPLSLLAHQSLGSSGGETLLSAYTKLFPNLVTFGCGVGNRSSTGVESANYENHETNSGGSKGKPVCEVAKGAKTPTQAEIAGTRGKARVPATWRSRQYFHEFASRLHTKSGYR